MQDRGMVRREILAHVRENPGESFASLMRAIDPDSPARLNLRLQHLVEAGEIEQAGDATLYPVRRRGGGRPSVE